MSTFQDIDIDLIDPHPGNPRRDVGDVTELADSIRSQGIRQNLLLVPHPDVQGRYRVIIGHRRLAAAKHAGVDQVPAVVDEDLTDAQQLELMLVENLQRVDLTPVEEARGYQEMLDLGVKVRDVVKRTGRSEKTVTGRLKLLKSHPTAQEKLHAGQTSIEDVLALAEFTEDEQERLLPFLGTPDFDWRASSMRRDREQAAETERFVADLEAAGVTEYPGPKAPPPGYRYWPANDRGDYPDGTVYVRTTPQRVTLYRPPTLDEQTDDSAQDDTAARRKAEEAKLTEDATTAWELRDAFVRQLVQRKLTVVQKSLILEHYLAPLRAGTYDRPYGLDPSDVKEWLPEDTDDERAEWLAEAPTTELMLAAMHIENDNTLWRWRNLTNGHAHRVYLADWYDLLVDLGYQLSSTETEAIAAGKAAQAEEEDEEAGAWVGPSGHVYEDQEPADDDADDSD